MFFYELSGYGFEPRCSHVEHNKQQAGVFSELKLLQYCSILLTIFLNI